MTYYPYTNLGRLKATPKNLISATLLVFMDERDDEDGSREEETYVWYSWYTHSFNTTIPIEITETAHTSPT
jgi:hypothetical protein